VRSLFLRIFLSFWSALALFLVVGILVTLALRPAWETLSHNVLGDTITAYERGGPSAALAVIEDVQAKRRVRVHIFDEQGVEITGRRVPEWVLNLAMGRPAPPSSGMGIRPRFFLDSRTSSDGAHRYSQVMLVPPGPHIFGGPHDPPVWTLLIGVLTSGLVCYLLAWYIAAPVVRLRQATQRLAAGDLSARAGVPGKRRDEIAGLIRDFDTMADRIESLLKSQSRLLNDISHELRSPLARLNVALGLARRRSGPETTEMLERIELEAERLNEMIGRLLTLARLEDAGTVPEGTDVSLNEIVEVVAADAEFEAQARKCRVKCALPDVELKVRGEASLLHSAIENVVRNAVRYTREDSQVDVTLERSADEAVVKVSDEGPGVAPESLGKLFQPFYRIDDARGRQTGGVGLGLSITDRAVRLHGGTVVASNRASGGLLVEIRLPLEAPG
jgi:signal transduction histidine kinase